jgi:hypothetical protein
MRTVPIIAALVMLSCTRELGSELGPEPGETIRRPATLAFLSTGPEVTVPQAVFVNQPVRVAFTTFGGGCVQSAESETTVAGLAADIRSFQREYIPRSTEECTSDLTAIGQSVQLTFAQPGQVRIRVFGQRYPDGSSVIVTRSITILP